MGFTVVIGIGNEFRRDDGAGPAVIERLRGRAGAGVRLLVSDGEPARLVAEWTGASLAVVVDAVRADPARPGRLHRLVIDQAGTGAGRSASTHGFGLGEAIGLANALHRMPQRLIVHAVEAADLTQGPGLTQTVEAAIEPLTDAVLRDISPY